MDAKRSRQTPGAHLRGRAGGVATALAMLAALVACLAAAVPAAGADRAPGGRPGQLHHGARVRVGGGPAYVGADLGDLNDRLIGYQLNTLDGRRHDPLHGGLGYGVVVERYLAPEWSVQASLEGFATRSRDGRTVAAYDGDGNVAYTVADEQTVEVRSTGVAAEIKRIFPFRNLLLAVGMGLEGRRVRIHVADDFGGTPMYDIWADDGFVLGGRTSLAATVRVAGPLVLDAAGGYSFLTTYQPKTDGDPWWWTDGATVARASVDLSGFFAHAGLGVLF